MPEPSHAVFLSYASQDTEAARRIAEALGAFGVEVWFDREELRGGDAWDAKIRRQIRECTLFVPLISAQTRARPEGYFRREWKLGIERTHDMAEDVTFLLPVVIDEIVADDARVPEKFLEVQWSHLPGGQPTSRFVEQVKHMLDQPRPSPTQAHGSGATPDHPQRRRGRVRTWMLIATLAITSAGALLFWVNEHPSPWATPVRHDGHRVMNEKSIAVLPFENMSEDRDANAFFADGMHEDVITNLALIRDLHVTSRTTALQYRGSKKSIREIGAELGVAYILEGSVRRSGTKVRVTGQLIDARTDNHLWAKSYDRDLSDAFAIQSELAHAIALALQAAVSPEEARLMQARPTQNAGAYDLFLKAREIRNAGMILPSTQQEQVVLLKAAVMLDPDFPNAWAELSYAYALQVLNHYEGSAENAVAAKDAIDRAIKLAPESPQVRRAHADCLYFLQRDYDQALACYEQLASSWPLDAAARYGIANIRRRQGRWSAAEKDYQIAQSLDPGAQNSSRQLANLYRACRRYDDAITEQRRLAARNPDSFTDRFELARTAFLANGSTTEGDALFPPGQAPAHLSERRAWLCLTGRLEESVPLYAPEPMSDLDEVDRATTLLALGRTQAAQAGLTAPIRQARARTVLEPENPVYWSTLAQMEALLGNRADAEAAARQAISLLPEERDAFSGPRFRQTLAFVHTWTGDTEAALQEFTHALRGSAGIRTYCNVHALRSSPWAFPLRNDPRWKALLSEPANNAPLF